MHHKTTHENTLYIIIVTVRMGKDNRHHVYRTRKGTCYEGSTRIPLGRDVQQRYVLQPRLLKILTLFR